VQKQGEIFKWIQKMNYNQIKKVLISVTDKTGVVELAKALTMFGVEIISTGGTAEVLKASEVTVTEISDYTGFPEILGGRVKTLHPKIHGGLLALRDNSEHVKTIGEKQIDLIDMVVINLYDFNQAISEADCTLENAIENIDIGGPAMLRAAAKNYRFVTAITSPSDYQAIIEEMKNNNGKISKVTNFKLMVKVFELTSNYDRAIFDYLGKKVNNSSSAFPEVVTMQFTKIQDLRYGENPHQRAAFYKDNYSSIDIGVDKNANISPNIKHYVKNKIEFLNGYKNFGIISAQKLHGKELSYNNILDSDVAWQIINNFNEPAAVIVKHTNPCGAALSFNLKDAYLKALATDPISAFGGIVAFNRSVDQDTAYELSKTFFEIIIAPEFDLEALKILQIKPNLRLLQILCCKVKLSKQYDFHRVVNGLLIQEQDNIENFDVRTAKIVTKKIPTTEEYADINFGWQLVKYVKSNAVVLVKDRQLISVGAGQTSRIDAMNLTVAKAKLAIEDSVLISDAFFPFRDVVDIAAKIGIKTIVQPGGSIKDNESIVACDENNIAMIFTGCRHFKH